MVKSGKCPLENWLTNALIRRQLIHSQQLPQGCWSEEEIQMIYENLSQLYENIISFDIAQHKLSGWVGHG